MLSRPEPDYYYYDQNTEVDPPTQNVFKYQTDIWLYVWIFACGKVVFDCPTSTLDVVMGNIHCVFVQISCLPLNKLFFVKLQSLLRSTYLSYQNDQIR